MITLSATVYCDGWMYPAKDGTKIPRCFNQASIGVSVSEPRSSINKAMRAKKWWRDPEHHRDPTFVCPECRAKMTGRARRA